MVDIVLLVQAKCLLVCEDSFCGIYRWEKKGEKGGEGGRNKKSRKERDPQPRRETNDFSISSVYPPSARDDILYHHRTNHDREVDGQGNKVLHSVPGVCWIK